MDTEDDASWRAYCEERGWNFENGYEVAQRHARARKAAHGTTPAVAPRSSPASGQAPPRPAPLESPPAGFSMYGWAACVHEAGHAVAALACGLRVTRVSVRDSGPYAEYSAAPDARVEAVVILAGQVAQSLLTDSKNVAHNAGYDDEQLAALGLSDNVLSQARREAEAIVCKHRDAIGRVASNLSRWGTASGEECSELFNMHI